MRVQKLATRAAVPTMTREMQFAGNVTAVAATLSDMLVHDVGQSGQSGQTLFCQSGDACNDAHSLSLLESRKDAVAA